MDTKTLNNQGGPCGPLDEQLITFLQEYIRINTSHPTPAYSQAINFLKKHAQDDGFRYQEILLKSGKKVLVISYLGTNPSLPALALNHHMDVVAASEQNWVKPPFAGEILNGEIIGRGTQDMKGLAAVHYFALKELKEQGVKLCRTVHMFAVPDEEIGGFTGTKEFVETPEFNNLNIGFVLDEGHASGQDQILDIKIAERKPLQVLVTSHGACAHGSRLACQNAICELVKFLERIVTLHAHQQKLIGEKQAGQLLSYNITSLGAGVKKSDGSVSLNIVPETAHATIDIRVPPTIKVHDVLKRFDYMIKQHVHIRYTVVTQAADEQIPDNICDTQLYKTLCNTIAACNFQARSHFAEGSSDLRYYLARGIAGVGFSPFTVKDNIHGTNESVPINQLIFGKNIMVQFLKDFCAGFLCT